MTKNQTQRTSIIFLLTLAAILTHSIASAATKGRERLLMDSGWKFHLGDPAGNATQTQTTQLQWRYKSVAQGQENLEGPAAADFQMDASWQEAGVSQDVFNGRRGFAWYRATLPNVPGVTRVLHFEGVDDNATVFVNGKKLLHHEGYDEPFNVPLAGVWREGGPNVVAVLVENTAGAGSIGAVGFQESEVPVDETYSKPGFQDSDWRNVHLPHDFVVEGTFTPTADASHGSLPTGIGWYRKTFTVPAADKDRAQWLDFDGIYRNAYIWLNGKLLGNHKSGYIGAHYDISKFVNYGGANTLAVRADARAQEGWWYEGGGIYRHVWLNKAEPVHIVPNGVFVAPDVTGKFSSTLNVNVGILPPSFSSAKYRAVEGRTAINVTVGVANSGSQSRKIRMVADIVDASGSRVARLTDAVASAPASQQVVTKQMFADDMRLWSLESPYLYHCSVKLYDESKLLDAVSVPFGVRAIKFDAQKGFFLNGKPVKIQGTCNHQDFAGVGIAMPDSLLEWRVKKLKAMGCNAYRMSHNPPAPELLDACDRLGMLVMDETRHLGDTYRPKTSRGTSVSDLGDLKEMVTRDRNHPSIIQWSLFNEEGLQGSDEGARIFKAMKEATLALDPNRPTTGAMNGGWGYGITFVEDLQGINYAPGAYEGFHQKFPDMPLFGSETASAVSTRGEYVNDPQKGYVSAYDVNAPSWGQTAEVAWKAIGTRDYVAGGYVWTGFDYKGEPTPYGWPCINSHFGIMDECGFPKDTYYYYLSWWGNKPVAHILPHWNWPGDEGKIKDVWVHSNADRVELFLNGASLGAKDMPRLGHLQWSVPYAPGKLEAKGYKDVAATPPYAVLTSGGRSAIQTRNYKLIVSDVVETTGKAAQIRLKPDRKTMTANGEEVIMVEVELLDEKGRVVPDANNEVSFEVTGAGQIGGVGNGDPSSHEPDKANTRHAFHGLCMAVVQAAEQPGSVQVTATSPGLKPANVTLQAKK